MGAGVGQGLKESVGSYCNGNAIWGVLHAELKAGWCVTGRNRQKKESFKQVPEFARKDSEAA